MKLITYNLGGEDRVGALKSSDKVLDIRDAVASALKLEGNENSKELAASYVPDDMTEFLKRNQDDLSWISRVVTKADQELYLSLPNVTIKAPVPRPGKVLGIGRNYGAHAGEGGLKSQAEPRIFAKMPSSVVGLEEPILLPDNVQKIDWEVELAVVVGRPMKNIAEADALSKVAGYTVLNDVSARGFQFDVDPPQTTFAKSMDGFTPMGPVILTADELPDPTDVDLYCWVNDELMQSGNTSDMIFPVKYILSYLSRFMTLYPGDIVTTGTPAGVGCFRDPPVYLKHGDRIRMELPKIGILHNTVVASNSNRSVL